MMQQLHLKQEMSIYLSYMKQHTNKDFFVMLHQLYTRIIRSAIMLPMSSTTKKGHKLFRSKTIQLVKQLHILLNEKY